MRCVKCSSSQVQLGQIDHYETVDEVTYTATIAAWICAKCGHSVVSDDALAVLERRMTGLLAQGPPGPNAVRLLRRWLGLKSFHLANLLMTRPETLSRWENGKQTIDPNAFGLLARMVQEDLEGRDGTLQYLTNRSARSAQTVSLGVIGSPVS